MQVESIEISKLILDPSNARKHSKKNLEAIKGSLAKFGQQKPVVVGKNNIVIAGNGTVLSAKELEWDRVDIVRTALEGTNAIAYAVADNRTGELAEWDDDVLSKTLSALQAEGFGLNDIGFDDDDLNKWIKETEVIAGCDEDEVPEQVEAKTKLGDLYQLSDHRLLCGDSTNIQYVERLMDGKKADMVFTDPPYGLGGYGGRNNMALEGDDKDPTGFYHAVPIEIPEVYVWGRIENYVHLNFKPRDTIVWRKNNFGLGRGYRGQYEVCFYKGSFDGSDSDVWDVPKDPRHEHPTQKPVALAERAIKNSNPKVVLDIFAGSGSTLIACEKTKRKCYGMEIDPHYCDVIVARWEKYTGKKASLLT